MISNPTIADASGAVRQLVSEGKPLEPAMQKLIDEKNRRANASPSVALMLGDQSVRRDHPAVLPPDPETAGSPKRSHKAKLDDRAAKMREKYATPAGAKPNPDPADHNAVIRRLLEITDGKTTLALDPPEGVKPGEYINRLMDTLRKRNGTRGYRWQCRLIGGRVVVSCLGPSSFATGEPETAQGAPESQVVPEAAPPPDAPTGGDMALAVAAPADCPVLAQEVHEFGLDIGHSLAVLGESVASPAVHQARAAFVEAQCPAVALAFQEAVGGQPEPAGSPDASRAPAPWAIRGIADAIPDDPPEAADLLQRTLDYFAEINMTEKKYEEYCEKHAPRLTEAILRHRRAKAIVESVLAPWCTAWEFTGAEEPFVDLARRFHRAIVGILEGAGKK